MDIILDKSFLQACSGADLCDLFKNYNVIITWTLFYEICTSDEMEQCFNKLCGKDLFFIESVNDLLAFEVEHNKACKPLIKIAKPGNINPRYTKEMFYDKYGDIINEINEDYRLNVDRLIELCLGSYQMYKKMGHNNVRESITDDECIINFYKEIKPPGFPDAELITNEWAIFRRVQIYLEYCSVRYGNINLKIKEKIEHDLHDLHLCIYTSLCDAIATNDQGIIQRLTKLSPHVQIVRSNKH